MPTYKINHFYDYADQGWTETFYAVSALSPVQITNYTAGDTFVWGSWRAPGVNFQSVRASDVANPRASYLNILNYVNKGAGGTAEPTNVSALIQLTAISLPSTRKLWLRGIVDTDVLRGPDGTSILQGQLGAALPGIQGWLAAKGYAIRQLQPATQNPWQGIGTLTAPASPGGLTQVTPVFGATPPTAGQLVYFKGIDDDKLPGLRGIFEVVTTSGNNFFIAYNWRAATPTVTPAKAFYRQPLYNYNPIQFAQFVRWGTRTTGRPISRLRGRRRALVRRQ